MKVVDVITSINELMDTKVTSFVSDSCNVMPDVRRKFLDSKTVIWTYGCAMHCLHNLFMNIGKITRLSNVIKSAPYISKSIKNVTMLGKFFDSLCG